MAILDEVKASLNVTNDYHDNDIHSTIEAAKQDMRMKGVRIIDENDAKTLSVIKLFCRAWYNYQGDGTVYDERYTLAANGMAKELEYNTIPEGDT